MMLLRVALYAVLSLISAAFVYPYWWMFVSSFRDTQATMVAQRRRTEILRRARRHRKVGTAAMG